MPNIKSAIKRVKTTVKKQVSNNDLKSSMKTAIKRVDKNVREANKEEAAKNLNLAFKKIDKACKANVIKDNAKNRYKSNLSKKINELK